jgi:hypothetical protein
MTARGSSSRQWDSLVACESLRGLPDLQLKGEVELQCRYLDVSCSVRAGYEEKVVETRRLELLTLSLQRRCSSS